MAAMFVGAGEHPSGSSRRSALLQNQTCQVVKKSERNLELKRASVSAILSSTRRDGQAQRAALPLHGPLMAAARGSRFWAPLLRHTAWKAGRLIGSPSRRAGWRTGRKQLAGIRGEIRYSELGRRPSWSEPYIAFEGARAVPVQIHPPASLTARFVPSTAQSVSSAGVVEPWRKEARL
jgi:hypothetical protein